MAIVRASSRIWATLRTAALLLVGLISVLGILLLPRVFSGAKISFTPQAHADAPAGTSCTSCTTNTTGDTGSGRSCGSPGTGNCSGCNCSDCAGGAPSNCGHPVGPDACSTSYAGAEGFPGSDGGGDGGGGGGK